MTEIYVDGSADNMNKSRPSYTAVWFPGLPVRIQRCNAETNNEAEYMAVLAGIIRVRISVVRGEVTIVSDSLLVVNQIKLVWKCKEPRLRKLRDEVLRVAAENPDLKFEYRWCRREVNQAGIEMDKFNRAKKEER